MSIRIDELALATETTVDTIRFYQSKGLLAPPRREGGKPREKSALDRFDIVHLAAQAGVRYSLESPRTYVDSNVVGFLNILEGCRAHPPGHLIFASTSSVYGNHANMPFNVHDAATHPITLYSASKLANEAMAHAYAHLFGVPATGFRFFTVYGPWGRPDMALFKFTDAILKGEPIDVYGEGRMQRDFTYVDDIVDGLVAALSRPPAPNPNWDIAHPDPATSAAPLSRVILRPGVSSSGSSCIWESTFCRISTWCSVSCRYFSHSSFRSSLTAHLSAVS